MTGDRSFAMVSGLYNAQWPPGFDPGAIGTRLAACELAMDRGLMEIILDSGDVLILEAPAKLRLACRAGRYKQS